ncbi:hypothetical protein HDU97_000787 [Phlyctochytrium planicorne]|nr:hypothetical protein HDU97_000787 [Phlyctochytrium planicorne]
MVIMTRTQWWSETTQSTVLMQQSVTAAAGLLISSIIRDTCWMAQGCLAAYWAFRQDTILPLPVSEAIQIGMPSLIINTRAPVLDKAMILLIPFISVLLAALYKFGITVGKREGEWKGIVRTVFASQPLDIRPIIVEGGCNQTYDPCKQHYLIPKVGVTISSPDLLDPKFAEGVENSTVDTSTSYSIHLGDVPSIDFEIRERLHSGISFTQVYMRAAMDCGRQTLNPWPDPCPLTSTTSPTAMPPTSGTLISNSSNHVSRLSVCNPIRDSRYEGVLTYSQDSLNLSCLYNISVFLRNVTAYPVNAGWNVVPMYGEADEVSEMPEGQLMPIGNQVLHPNRIGFSYWSPLSLSNEVITSSGFPCFGPVCKGKSSQFEAAVAANSVFRMSLYAYWFLHSSNDDELPTEEPLEGFPGRVVLDDETSANGTKWIKVWTPTGLRNVTNPPGRRSIVGAEATMRILEGTFVQVEYWLLAFGLLVIFQIVFAAIKIWNHSHPLEAVGGFVWTLRKVDSKIAAEACGVGLADLLDMSREMRLGRVEDVDGKRPFLRIVKDGDENEAKDGDSEEMDGVWCDGDQRDEKKTKSFVDKQSPKYVRRLEAKLLRSSLTLDGFEDDSLGDDSTQKSSAPDRTLGSIWTRQQSSMIFESRNNVDREDQKSKSLDMLKTRSMGSGGSLETPIPASLGSTSETYPRKLTQEATAARMSTTKRKKTANRSKSVVLSNQFGFDPQHWDRRWDHPSNPPMGNSLRSASLHGSGATPISIAGGSARRSISLAKAGSGFGESTGGELIVGGESPAGPTLSSSL